MTAKWATTGGESVAGSDGNVDGSQKVVNHLLGRIAGGGRVGRELVDLADFVPASNHGCFGTCFLADLRQANIGHQAIADAFSANRVFLLASLADERLNAFSRASPANGPVRLFVSGPEVAQIADAIAMAIDGGFRSRPRHAEKFKGKSGGRGLGVGKDIRSAVAAHGQDAFLDLRAHPGFFAEGESGSDLDAGGASEHRFPDSIGIAIGPGEPKREIQFSKSGEFDGVSITIDGFTARIQF